MEQLEKYRQMLKELAEIRHRHKFNNSKEEDLFVLELDEQWRKLSLCEQKLLWDMQRVVPLMEQNK